MPNCPMCGTEVAEQDRSCRRCGGPILPSNLTDIQAGRTLVIVAAVILLGLHLATFLFAFASMTSGVETSDWLSNLVTGTIELCLLYLVFRGHAWARWLTGLLALAGVVLGLTFLLRASTPDAASALILVLVIGMAVAASILLLIPSVRTFQRAQRQALADKRKSAA